MTPINGLGYHKASRFPEYLKTKRDGQRQIEIQTKDGPMSTFIVHPERGGPYPVFLFNMDAPGIREELPDRRRMNLPVITDRI